MTVLALDDDLPEIAPTKPVWLMTLADLALLLVGFFVFMQASQHLEKAALARGIREGFGVHDKVAAPTPDPMPVSAGAIGAFAPGSAILPQGSAALIAWAREAARDPRVTLRVSGAVDGSTQDVDSTTGSGVMLAADRARGVAAALLLAHAVAADRITIVSANRPGHRAVTITTGYAGDRQ